MGGLDVKVWLKPCKWCGRPVKQRRWWRPKRFCSRWHHVKYRFTSLVAEVVDSF
ncbi:hypothetical protein ACH43Y_33895 [Streptomyces rubiginosohelvolus]|uniref:hypothetical protein n=1 Tax=Streptomyces rubiginosohelvolus TaxID=67362 RepID=UPI0037B9A82D